MVEFVEDIQKSGYQYLVEKFGKEKIKKRYQWLYNQMLDFIEAKDLEEKVLISDDILCHVIVDYFVDIDRLKEFQEIEKTQPSKIYAYTVFWLLRHKPMQITIMENAPELTFVNEEFASYLIRELLFSEPDAAPIMENQREKVDNFVDTMLYYFQYRDFSAKNIELMILAFEAGRGYQYSVNYRKSH
ncbi:hypothetical protein [Schaedlerella sp.]|uniref:hypothetical protein n=1 Tax=Schaedlerella sp. TaxID=2676057 RepID=UPI003746D716